MKNEARILQRGISAVVPVFNSETSLPKLVERLEKVFATLNVDFEVLLVDDGSRDDSWKVICELARRKSWVRGIQLMRNFGQHNALLCGIRAANYPVTVVLDDDGQNPPEEIPRLLERLDAGYDLVFGAPKDERHGVCRRLASQLTKLAIRSVLGAHIAPHVSSFKAFRTRLRDAFANYEGTFVAIDVLLSWGAASVTSVRVRHEPRRHGQTNYTFKRLVDHALNMMTSFSTLPLRLASIVGFLFTLFGFGVLVYVLGHYFLVGSIVDGFPFLASIITLFSGAQLFALGIIGEYLARVHFRSMDKPAYIVEQEIASFAPLPTAQLSPSEQTLSKLKTA